MRKQLKKIAWLFAFGLFMFAAPLSFGNDQDEDAFEGGGGQNGRCNEGCVNRPNENIGKCRYEFKTCGILYKCENETWTWPKDCVYAL